MCGVIYNYHLSIHIYSYIGSSLMIMMTTATTMTTKKKKDYIKNTNSHIYISIYRCIHMYVEGKGNTVGELVIEGYVITTIRT